MAEIDQAVTDIPEVDTVEQQVEDVDYTDETVDSEMYTPEEVRDPVPDTEFQNAQKEQAIRAGMGSPEGTDMVERYADALVESPYVTMQREIQESLAGIHSFNVALLEEGVADGPATAALVAEDIQERSRNKYDARFLATIAPDEATVRKMPGAELYSEDTIMRLSSKMYLRRMVAEQLDYTSASDWAGAAVDLVGSALVPDQSYNIAVALGKMGVDASFLDRYWNSGPMWTKLGEAIRNLPPEHMVAAFNELNEVLKDIDDNDLTRVFDLMDIAQPNETWLSTNASHALDKITVIPAVGSVVGIFKKAGLVSNAMRKLGILNISASAPDPTELQKVVLLASKSNEGAESINTSRTLALASGDPSAGVLADTILAGMAPEKATIVKEAFKANDRILHRGLELVDETIGLTDKEKAAALAGRSKTMEAIIAADEAKKEGSLGIELLELKTTAKGIEVSYLQGAKVGVPEKIVRNLNYTVDDITGGFNSKGIGNITTFIKLGLSPNFLFKKDKQSLVNTMERLIMQEGKIKDALSKELVTPFRSLSKDSSNRVAGILAYGDKMEKEYNYTQLVTNGVNKVRLTEEEFFAYANSRRVMDKIYHLKNKEIRTAMEAQSIKRVSILGETFNTKMLNEAGLGISASRGQFIYQPHILGKDGLPTMHKMTPEALAEAYTQGYVLAKATNNADTFGTTATRANLALVSIRDVSELPALVLSKRGGYIPRSYDKARYFVREQKNVKINGVDDTILKTSRYFDNIADAEKFVAQERLKYPNKIILDPHYNREAFADPLGDDTIRVFGNMYDGRRASEPLKFGLAGDSAPLIDPLEAMSDYINHISTRLPMSEYRLAIQARWLSHAKNLDSTLKGTFREVGSAVESSSRLSPANKSFLISSRDQIHNMMKMPTDSELRMQENIRGFADSASRGGHSRLAKFLYGSGSGLDGVKGANFHLLLGMYSPVQTFVQGFGASISASINPILFGKAMIKLPRITKLDLINTPADFTKAMNALKKSDPDLYEQYKLWDKSGLKETVMSANADMGSMFTGNPFSGKMISKVMRNNGAFFKAGELFSIRSSFGTAVEHFKDINNIKKGYKFTDADLKVILARTESYRLHMSSANKAGYQKGLSGIPTQFQQVNTKFLETLVGSDFNTVEKAKLGLGMTTLFGLTGTPLATTMAEYILDAADVDFNSIDPADMLLLKNGLTGWVFNDLLDTDALVTGRVAFAGDFLENFYDALFTPGMEAPFSQLLGPTGNLIDAGMGVLNTIAFGFNSTISHDDLGDAAVTVTQMLGKLAVDLPSSTRNLLAAYQVAHSSVYTKSNGDILPIEDGDRYARMIAQGLGVQSISMKDMYELGKSDRARQAAEKHYSGMLIKAIQSAHTFSSNNESTLATAAVATVSSLVNDIKDLDARDRIMKQVLNKIKNPTDESGKAFLKAVSNQFNEFQNGANLLNPTLLRLLNGDT